ncbi:MAG: hypothetical protein JO220_14255 [Hyphomicrobiales bacterium]|nr:hypothetical protein [Hyphomicrobiales bacterium]
METSQVSVMSTNRQEEVDRNLEYFLSELPRLSHSHLGEFALLRHRTITDFFSTSVDAVKAGKSLYPDGMFSVQQVTDAAIDLGFFSHAGNNGSPQ